MALITWSGPPHRTDSPVTTPLPPPFLRPASPILQSPPRRRCRNPAAVAVLSVPRPRPPMAYSPFLRPKSTEIELMCYIMPAPEELVKVEEAAAGLLDLAGVEKGEVATPKTVEEAVNLGPELRRRGSELVLGIERDMRLRRMVELKTCVLARIKARAAAASSSSGLQNSELIRLVKFVGVEKVEAQYVSKGEHKLMLKMLTNLLKQLSRQVSSSRDKFSD